MTPTVEAQVKMTVSLWANIGTRQIRNLLETKAFRWKGQLSGMDKAFNVIFFEGSKFVLLDSAPSENSVTLSLLCHLSSCHHLFEWRSFLSYHRSHTSLRMMRFLCAGTLAKLGTLHKKSNVKKEKKISEA